MSRLDKFLIFMGIFFLFVSLLAILILSNEGSKCVGNPINYAFSNMENNNNASILCTCSLIGNKVYPTFILTKNGLEILK